MMSMFCNDFPRDEKRPNAATVQHNGRLLFKDTLTLARRGDKALLPYINPARPRTSPFRTLAEWLKTAPPSSLVDKMLAQDYKPKQTIRAELPAPKWSARSTPSQGRYITYDWLHGAALEANAKPFIRSSAATKRRFTITLQAGRATLEHITPAKDRLTMALEDAHTLRDWLNDVLGKIDDAR